MDVISVSELWAQVAGSSAAVWLLADPTGQRVALGAVLVALVLGLWLFAKFGQTLAKKCRHLPKLLLAVGGGYYAAVLLLKLDATQWAPAAAALGLSLLVAALALVAFRQRGKSSPKAKPA